MKLIIEPGTLVFSALCNLVKNHHKKSCRSTISVFCSKYVFQPNTIRSMISMDIELNTPELLVFDVVRRDKAGFSKHSVAVQWDIWLRKLLVSAHGGGAPIEGGKDKYHKELVTLIHARLSAPTD